MPLTFLPATLDAPTSVFWTGTSNPSSRLRRASITGSGTASASLGQPHVCLNRPSTGLPAGIGIVPRTHYSGELAASCAVHCRWEPLIPSSRLEPHCCHQCRWPIRVPARMRAGAWPGRGIAITALHYTPRQQNLWVNAIWVLAMSAL